MREATSSEAIPRGNATELKGPSYPWMLQARARKEERLTAWRCDTGFFLA